jgi:hypothetical protein
VVFVNVREVKGRRMKYQQSAKKIIVDVVTLNHIPLGMP